MKNKNTAIVFDLTDLHNFHGIAAALEGLRKLYPIARVPERIEMPDAKR